MDTPRLYDGRESGRAATFENPQSPERNQHLEQSLGVKIAKSVKEFGIHICKGIHICTCDDSAIDPAEAGLEEIGRELTACKELQELTLEGPDIDLNNLKLIRLQRKENLPALMHTI